MSDGGGGESSKEIESTLKKRRRKNDEFPQSIAKIAVAQVCESVGFQGFQQSALDTFSDVACKYIREIGKTSNFYANLSGRTECNVFDIVQGLEDLSLSQGFLGASDRDHCLSGSGIIKELSQFVNLSEEIAFAYSVPSFPVIKERKLSQTFFQSGETPPTDIIPPWLPKFPDSKTYITIPPSITEENSNSRMIPDRIEQEQKVLDFEQPSSKLEQTCHVSEFPNNPFLAVPLPPGEKEVSLVTIPVKLKEEDELQNNIPKANHVSASDIVQENQRGDNNGCDNSEEGIRRKVLVNNRSAVKMKFQIPKKPLETADVLEHNEKGKSEVVCWFMNDEKEKRMEKLVKEQDQEQEQDQDHEHQQMEIEGGNGNDSVVN